jgi:cation diffusion facilitator family transporter
MSQRPLSIEPCSQGGDGVERWGWYSIVVNVILAGINLAVARASGSLAVEAEMIHNLVDLITAIGVLIGLKLSTRKTKAFPYGLYKLENVVAVVLAMMTFITAYEIGRDALLESTRIATVDAWMLVGVIVAAVVPLVFSHFELRVGRTANSPALIADAKEYRAHVFTTGVVLASLLAQWLDFPIDRVAALIIVVAICKTGWELLADGMRVLLDASMSPQAILDIRKVILEEPAVSALKWVTGRNAGRFRFVEAEVEIRGPDLKRAEAATQRIEAGIRQAVSNVERVLIHAQPMARTHLRFAAPLADPAGAISKHFGEAPYFGLVRARLAGGVVEERSVLANLHHKEEKAKGIRVAEWLVAQKADVVLVRESLRGKGPVYVFREAGVELREIEAVGLDEAIEVQLLGQEEDH